MAEFDRPRAINVGVTLGQPGQFDDDGDRATRFRYGLHACTSTYFGSRVDCKRLRRRAHRSQAFECRLVDGIEGLPSVTRARRPSHYAASALQRH